MITLSVQRAVISLCLCAVFFQWQCLWVFFYSTCTSLRLLEAIRLDDFFAKWSGKTDSVKASLWRNPLFAVVQFNLKHITSVSIVKFSISALWNLMRLNGIFTAKSDLAVWVMNWWGIVSHYVYCKEKSMLWHIIVGFHVARLFFGLLLLVYI